MAFWKKPLRLGLQARISLLAALGLVLIFTFMIWEDKQIADANAEMVLQERLNLARVIAQHLDQDLDRTLSRLEQVAAFPTINLMDDDLEPEKAELRALYRPDDYSYVFLLDKDGLVLWTEPYLPDVVNREHMDCPHVQGTLYTGEPSIACVAHALTPLSPVIAPVVPIRNRQGAIVGALGAAIDPSSPPFVQIFQGMAPGNTGYTQPVDENGIVLAHTERQHLFQKSEHADLFISVLKDKKPVVAAYTVTEENKGTFRQVIAFAPLTAAPWGVAVEQDEAEFLAPSLEASRRMELFAVTAMAVAFVLVWVTTLSVIRTVRKLMEASERIAAGDLSTPVAISGSDEVSELGRNFETMRRRLASWGEELEAAVQKRPRQLSVLYAIDRAAAQSLDLEEILNDSLDKILETLEVEAGGVYLLEPDGETLTLRVHRGLPDEFVTNVRRIKLGEGISGRAAAEKKPITLDVAEYPTARLAPYIVQEGFQTLASTPLLSAGELVGALNVGTRRPRAFPPEEMELLTSIGQQLGGAVANARLHQSLLASEQEYRTLVENATELIWTLDMEGRFTFVNRQAEEASGHRAEDLLSQSFAPMIAPQDLSRIQQIFLETLAGKPQSYEVGVYRADSSIFYLSVNTTPMYRDGAVIGTISFGRDVTAQQEAEAALTKRMAELSALFSVSSAMRGTKSVAEMLPVILEQTARVIGADGGSIFLAEAESGEFVCQTVYPPPRRGGKTATYQARGSSVM